MSEAPLSASAAAPLPPGRKPPLPALTGVRTVLALNILFFHFTPPHLDYLYPVINNGFVFVGFFFLLSGFILTYNYGGRTTPLDKRNFWVARFSRLYPVYALSLLVSFPVLLAEWHYRPHLDFAEGLLMTPLLLQGWSPDLSTFWNTVAWTLSSEATLYLLFPYLLAMRLPKSIPRLIGLFFLLWAVGLIPHMTYLALNPDHLTAPADRYTYGYWLRAVKYTPIPYVCTFISGMVLARLQEILDVPVRARFWMSAAAILALVLTFYLAVPHLPYVMLHGGLLTPLAAVLVLGCCAPHFITTIFSWKPIATIGAATFCLYLLHFNTYIQLHEHHIPERLHVAAFDPWFSYLVCIGFALFAHHYVETPARRALQKKFGRKPTVATLATE